MIIERLGRGTPTQDLAGTTIEGCGDSCEVVGAVSAQVSAFREVLAK